jgi:hypothetical protein
MRLNPNITAAAVVLAAFVAAALAMHHVSHRVPHTPVAAADTLAPVSAATPPPDRGDATR